MYVTIRKFEEKDIENKIEWINNPLNNKYLHYDLPLKLDKTLNWYQNNKDRNDRYDGVIEVDKKPIGVIGLLGIELEKKEAEYYITIGDRNFLGQGIAYKATNLLLEYAFTNLKLNKVFLFTEVENKKAQKLFEKIGFKKERMLKNEIYYQNRYISRYIYNFYKQDFYMKDKSFIHYLDEYLDNKIYIKRDDFIPFSFGGNKARKGLLYLEEIKSKKSDCIVTYGSSSSNHCRVIANIAIANGLKCYIISPKEIKKETYNTKLMRNFKVNFIYCDVVEVSETIEKVLKNLKQKGCNPYFIQGGGHGNIGTQAYFECYQEIISYEKRTGIEFDYIFHASGTGTTQAGLICGKILENSSKKIIGISIARRKNYGKEIVEKSIKEYMDERFPNIKVEEEAIFLDDYIVDGYGSFNKEIKQTIVEVLNKYGVPLDKTYTGKAFWGMKEYILRNKLRNKNILFIHTGGTPLFFDDLKGEENECFDIECRD